MIKGFILAAGFSKRLRPITEHIPKPLLPIAGEIMLDRIYKFLKSLEITEIGINLHYKADEIENYIKENNLSLEIFHERDILDTAGALYNAKNFLKDCIVIVHNSDIYWDGNIKEAIEWHLNLENAITLLVHDHFSNKKLIVDSEGNLVGLTHLKSSTHFQSLFAFTGVAIYNSDVLKILSEGPSSVIDLWFKAKEKGLKVKVFPVKYNFWFDIGTPVGFASAVFNKLKRNFTSLYVHPTSSGCELIDPEGNVVIERNVRIEKPFRGKNLIILPETVFSKKIKQISNCIIGKNFIVSICGWQKQKENLSSGGSTRNYFRKQKKVFCEWEEVNEEFKKTVILGKFFRQKGFPVPNIIDVIQEKKLIIFEDLGNLTLYSWLQCRRKEEEIINIYKKVIENIINLHWRISSETSQLEISLPEFDYEYFRWESNYFLRECVEGVFKLNLFDFKTGLQQELHLIAEKLSQTKKVILHRDLQSQNIMLRDKKVYFVDYQSARWGPAGYDLASLLWDPYIYLTDKIREKLINFYIENLPTFNFQPKAFFEELLLCRIQRHMQTLGAYSFLSLKRNKKNFLKFIPSALNLLYEDIKECSTEMCNLKELVLRLKTHQEGLKDLLVN
ncbi:MAG: sugar phosphate nucleotidyltransferase [Thermodesulfovibrionaceae bacterium]